MALRDLSTKIHSLKNTSKITKAMEVVSSVKLKKVEKATFNATNYYELMKQFLQESMSEDLDLKFPIFEKDSIEYKDALIVVVGTGKGLVGGLLHRLKSELFELNSKLLEKGINPHIVSVKTKTLDLLRELNMSSELHFGGAFEEGSINEITPIKKTVLDYYPNKVQKVFFVFMKFENAFSQIAVTEQFLPLDKKDFKIQNINTALEPSSHELVEHLVEDYLEAYLIYVMLNSSCSEFASRVVTMKQATNNATELQSKYQLKFNKQRQTQITSQIQEAYLSSYIQE